MSPPLFPTLNPGFPATKSPIWNTDVQESVTGKRTTLALYSYPRYGFTIPYEGLRSDSGNLELQDMMAFYNQCNGRANLFRFTDPNDSVVTAQQFGTGDGATTQFQLTRALTGKTFTWIDPVFYPETSVLFSNGTPISGGSYSITNGLVTFNTAPLNGVVLTWTGTFSWLCRFDEDTATFEQFMASIYSNKGLKFSSEKI